MILLALRLTALLLVATGVAWGLRRRSAALRAALWTAVLASSLLLPLLPRPEIAVARTSLPMVIAPPRRALPLIKPASTEEKGQSLIEAREPLDLAAVVWRLYVLGVAVSLASFVVALTRVSRLVRSSDPASERIANVLRRIAGDRPQPRIRLAAEGTPPLVAGPLRPTILLPRSAHAWDEARLERVLRHEFAHVERGDGLALMLGRLTTAVYWWHPLVRWAARELRQECERAADDVALGGAVRPSEYAEELLAWSDRPAAPAATLPMARRAGLPGRLRHVLDAGADRRRASGRARLGLLLSATLLAGLLPGVRAQVEAKIVAPIVRAAAAPSGPPGPSLFRTRDGSTLRIRYLLSMDQDLVLHAWDLYGRPVDVDEARVRLYVKNEVRANPSKDKRWVGIVYETVETDPDPTMQPYTYLQANPKIEFVYEATLGGHDGRYRDLEMGLAPRGLKAMDLSLTFAPNRYEALWSGRVGKGPRDAQLLAKAPSYADAVHFVGLDYPMRWVRIPKAFDKTKPWDLSVKAVFSDGSSIWATTLAMSKADEEFAAFSANPRRRIVRVEVETRLMAWYDAKNLPLFPR